MDKSSKKSIKECDMSHHKDVCGQKIIYQQTQPSNVWGGEVIFIFNSMDNV